MSKYKNLDKETLITKLLKTKIKLNQSKTGEINYKEECNQLRSRLAPYQNKSVAKFCFGCDNMFIGEGVYLDTSKWGHEREFCNDCVNVCSCGEQYANTMSYQHEDCKNSDSDESATDVDTEESSEGEREELKEIIPIIQNP